MELWKVSDRAKLIEFSREVARQAVLGRPVVSKDSTSSATISANPQLGWNPPADKASGATWW